MIKKTILAVVVMLLGYHLVFPHLSQKYFQLSGPQRDNFFRAQQYVHKVPPQTKVILGSSLSLRFNDGMLGQDYYKLAFGGGSVFTGLEIIRHTNKRPPIVLIEINEIGWEEDKVLLHNLLAPWRRRLRDYSRIFREEGRPANFVNGVGELFVRKLCHWTSRRLGQEPASDSPNWSKAENPALFSRLYRVFHDEHLAAAPPNLTGQTNRLGDRVDELTRNGSLCVFYEMPIDSSLSELPSPAAVRSAMEKRFPKNRYRWLEFPHDHDYDTYDGLHVSQPEANRLTEILITQVNQISK
jgi:hypothetical protein